MKCSDGTTITERQLVYFEDGQVKVQISLFKSYCQSEREVYFSRTLNQLIKVTQSLYDENANLRKENARICKRPARPKLKPSKISITDSKYRSAKKRKTVTANPDKKKLSINEVVTLSINSIPKSARFKGYQTFTVQDIEIKPITRQYRRERWQLSSGELVVAPLPEHVDNQHYGAQLRQYILYQYYHQRVTQPLLLNQLREWGLSISAGQLSNLITKNKESWHAEKEELLTKALKTSAYIQVDDTGAKHFKEKYYCTHVGNEQFAFFDTRPKKSRLNFLSILQGKNTGFCLNEHAVHYMELYSNTMSWVTDWFLEKAADIGYYSNVDDWQNLLLGSFIKESNYKSITEAAMLGYMAHNKRINPELIILSDAAGQFNLQRNAACWVHAERILTGIIPDSERVTRVKDKKLKQFWMLYRYINAKRHKPQFAKILRCRVEAVFDDLCQPLQEKSRLDKPLSQLNRLKSGLLAGLERTEIPLHNNQSESDIREFVIRRIVSGATKSKDGLLCRDTFISLKKTAQRHQISFWNFLGDRLFKKETIPLLSDYISE